MKNLTKVPDVTKVHTVGIFVAPFPGLPFRMVFFPPGFSEQFKIPLGKIKRGRPGNEARIYVHSYLHDIQSSLVADVREGDGYCWISDGMPFLHLVSDVFKWSLTVHQLIEDTAKRPDVTGSTNLLK